MKRPLNELLMLFTIEDIALEKEADELNGLEVNVGVVVVGFAEFTMLAVVVVVVVAVGLPAVVVF